MPIADWHPVCWCGMAHNPREHQSSTTIPLGAWNWPSTTHTAEFSDDGYVGKHRA